MTSAFRLRRSEIRSGRSSSRPSADRYSILRFCPSTYPYSRSPARKSASSVLSALLKGDSTPTIGNVRCAHASRGAEIAAAPRATTNSRRFIASPDAQGNAPHSGGQRRRLEGHPTKIEEGPLADDVRVGSDSEVSLLIRSPRRRGLAA